MINRTSVVVTTIATLAIAAGGCKRSTQERSEVETTSADQPGKLTGGSMPTRGTTKPSAEEAAKLAEEAYIYGYPLVTVEMTRRVMTNVATATGLRAPMGQFALLKEYPTPKDRDVTAPNADTLYSSAFVDVTKEPYVFSIPDAGDRYFLMPMLDANTNVFQVPGKRTTGTKAQTYAITGPAFTGKLPDGVTEYKAPTNLVWIIGRTYCTGTPADYAAVHAFQAKLALVPLSAYGKPYTPPQGTVDPSIDMKTDVRDQVHQLDAASYFKMLNGLLEANPPPKADAPILERIAKIGVGPGLDVSRVDPQVAQAMREVPTRAIKTIHDHLAVAGKNVNGWTFWLKTGQYGTDYLDRALVTMVGLGANRPEDAVYPASAADADHNPYSGANKYVMHFAKGQMPPVKGFWSLTMYDDKMFFVENPIHRYSVSPRNDLKVNADGSTDLYIQNASPGKDKESNWLPAPTGKFNVMLRMYWPDHELLDGTWAPPAVTLAKK